MYRAIFAAWRRVLDCQGQWALLSVAVCCSFRSETLVEWKIQRYPLARESTALLLCIVRLVLLFALSNPIGLIRSDLLNHLEKASPRHK